MAAKKAKFTVFEEALLFELRAIRFAVNDHSANTGKWLAAIAKAAANPADNSTEVQKMIDNITASLNASATAEEEALNKAKQLKEN